MYVFFSFLFLSGFFFCALLVIATNSSRGQGRQMQTPGYSIRTII
jgi:hypothetical protein